ncbi:hypothetical protein Pcinc_022956 [Petrolisthes cinctipes]|uniref:Uncharacterized protein n=1 Tax=Petrolisthes cinctipes TaxID=88211 RepID=A0AAE1FCQ9_PETCI|nr:hypothetical protein Pcinc_022956 [Petrolisthes cinctipes]
MRLLPVWVVTVAGWVVSAAPGPAHTTAPPTTRPRHPPPPPTRPTTPRPDEGYRYPLYKKRSSSYTPQYDYQDDLLLPEDDYPGYRELEQDYDTPSPLGYTTPSLFRDDNNVGLETGIEGLGHQLARRQDYYNRLYNIPYSDLQRLNQMYEIAKRDSDLTSLDLPPAVRGQLHGVGRKTYVPTATERFYDAIDYIKGEEDEARRRKKKSQGVSKRGLDFDLQNGPSISGEKLHRTPVPPPPPPPQPSSEGSGRSSNKTVQETGGRGQAIDLDEVLRNPSMLRYMQDRLKEAEEAVAREAEGEVREGDVDQLISNVVVRLDALERMRGALRQLEELQEDSDAQEDRRKKKREEEELWRKKAEEEVERRKMEGKEKKSGRRRLRRGDGDLTDLFLGSSREDCPVLERLVVNCEGVSAEVGDEDQVFLPHCLRHEICYMCGSGQSVTGHECDAILSSGLESACAESVSIMPSGSLDCLGAAGSTFSLLSDHSRYDNNGVCTQDPCVRRFLESR